MAFDATLFSTMQRKTIVNVFKSKKAIDDSLARSKTRGLAAPMAVGDRRKALTEAVDIYSKQVSKTLKSLVTEFSINLVLITIGVVLTVVAGIWSDKLAILTTLGMGAASFGGKAKEWFSTFKAFFNDRNKLEVSVSHLKSQLKNADDDAKKLDDVEKSLNDYYANLKEALAPSE